MDYTTVITLVIALGAGFGFGYWLNQKLKPLKEEKLNHSVREELKQAQASVAAYRVEEGIRREELVNLDKEIVAKRDQLKETIAQEASIAQSVAESEMERAREAFAAYVDTLTLSYLENEQDYDDKISFLTSELGKMKAARDAYIQASLREQELKEKENFYKITILDGDLQDIVLLESIKPKLRRPDVLSKLIWTTYYQKGIGTVCNNVVGDSDKSGIYKLTDSTTQLAYIGQSVAIAQRWKDHVKSALGASNTVASNKLYTTMRESGIHNFTFEVLEFCPPEQLNEKERYWIDFYQTSVYGLNTVKGVSK